jgi:hypothetical protein
MNAQHIYQEAIDCLMAPTIDYRTIVIALAKRYPNVLIELANGTKEDWHVFVLEQLKKGEKVNAIKETRFRTGLGLKEAKDIVDYAMHIGHVHGLSYDYGDHLYTPHLSTEHKNIATRIAA